MKKQTLLRFLVLALVLNACEDSPFFQNDDLISSIETTWHCSEVGTLSNSQVYLVDITRYAANSDSIVLDNFYNIGTGQEMLAIVTGQDITIPTQVVDGFTFSGTGHIEKSAKSITFTYTADDGSHQIDHLSAVYTRL